MKVTVKGSAKQVKLWNSNKKLTDKEYALLKSLFKRESPFDLEAVLKCTGLTWAGVQMSLRNLSQKGIVVWEYTDGGKWLVQSRADSLKTTRTRLDHTTLVTDTMVIAVTVAEREISTGDKADAGLLTSGDTGDKAKTVEMTPGDTGDKKENNNALIIRKKNINSRNKTKDKKDKKPERKKGAQTTKANHTTGKTDLTGYTPDQKWNILKHPKHKLYPRVSKAVAQQVIDQYNIVRGECGYKPYFQAMKYKDKFITVAVFCHEYGADVLEYFREGPDIFYWLKGFPGPANMAGPHMMNAWLDKDVQRRVGGKQYRQASSNLKDILAGGGFDKREYTPAELRYIQSVAKDAAKFGNVDINTVKFKSEIKWLVDQIKNGGVKV